MGFHTYFFYKREETGYYIVAFPPGEKATLYMYFFYSRFSVGKSYYGETTAIPVIQFFAFGENIFPLIIKRFWTRNICWGEENCMPPFPAKNLQPKLKILIFTLHTGHQSSGGLSPVQFMHIRLIQFFTINIYISCFNIKSFNDKYNIRQ